MLTQQDIQQVIQELIRHRLLEGNRSGGVSTDRVRSMIKKALRTDQKIDFEENTVQDLELLTTLRGVKVGSIGLVLATGNLYRATAATGASSIWEPASGAFLLRDFGGVPGLDSNGALTAAVATITAAGGGALIIDYVSTIAAAASHIITVPLTLRGEKGGSLSLAGSTAPLLDCRQSNLTVEGLDVSAGSDAFCTFENQTALIEFLRVDDCKFTGFTGDTIFNLPDKTTAGITHAWVTDSYFNGAQRQLYLNGILNKLTVSDCHFFYPNEVAVWGGYDDQNLAEGDFVVTNNIFEKIGDGTAQPSPERHAFIGFGKRIVVTGNTVNGVDNDTQIECEGFYVKAQNCVVTNNTMLDGGRGQGSIAIKGQPEGTGGVGLEEGWDVIVTDNVIEYTAARGGTNKGISVGNGGQTLVRGNIVHRYTGVAITVGGTTSDQDYIRIQGNVCKGGTAAQAGISVDSGGADVDVRDNLVKDQANAAGSSVGLQIVNNQVTAYQNVIIENNTFRNITGLAGSSVGGIFDNMTQNPSIENYIIRGNVVDESDYGLIYTAASPRYTRHIIEQNTFTNLTKSIGGEPSAIYGQSKLLTNQTLIRWNVGFVTENQGTATFDGVSADLVITHGLERTALAIPRVKYIAVIADPGGRLFLKTLNATTFTVTCTVVPAVGRRVDWFVIPQGQIV